MTTYRIGSILVHPEQSDFSVVLGDAYKANLKPFCMCKGEPGFPMYITHIGDGFFIKRNPNTGRAHEVGCGSWEMPDEFSGRSDLGSGVTYEEGKALLRLAFPLAKQGNRVAPPPKAGGSDDKLSVKNDSKRLSLQGLLHMLWDEAGLAKWQGGGPDRKWDLVRQSLLEAADDKVVKQHALSYFMFVPEAWVRERAEEQESMRRKRFIEFSVQQSKKGHQLMLLIAEVKSIEPSSSGGYRMVFKHVPGFSFSLNDELKGRIDKHYAKEAMVAKSTEERHSHQIVAATFSVQAEGTAEIEEICYMPVNSQWIPFDNIYEHELFGKLISTKRTFLRPLRYNRLKTAVMPSVVLTDTGSGPTALYVVPPEQDSEKYHAASLEVDYNKWFWDMKEQADKMPDLPPRMETTEGEREYLERVGQQPHGGAAPPVVRTTPVFKPEPPPAHPFLNTSTLAGSQPQATSGPPNNRPTPRSAPPASVSAAAAPAASTSNEVSSSASASQPPAAAPVHTVQQANETQRTQPQAQVAAAVKTLSIPLQPVTTAVNAPKQTPTEITSAPATSRPVQAVSPANGVPSSASANQPTASAPVHSRQQGSGIEATQSQATATAKMPTVQVRPITTASQSPNQGTPTTPRPAPVVSATNGIPSPAPAVQPRASVPVHSAPQNNGTPATRPLIPTIASAQQLTTAIRATNPAQQQPASIPATPRPAPAIVRSAAPQAPVASQARPISAVTQGAASQLARPAGPVTSGTPARPVSASPVAPRPMAPQASGSSVSPVARPASPVTSAGLVRPAMPQAKPPVPVSQNPSIGSQQSTASVRPQAPKTGNE
jgi:hypothetical protein